MIITKEIYKESFMLIKIENAFDKLSWECLLLLEGRLRYNPLEFSGMANNIHEEVINSLKFKVACRPDLYLPEYLPKEIL
jgi:hypothetical protein